MIYIIILLLLILMVRVKTRYVLIQNINNMDITEISKVTIALINSNGG